VILAVIQYWKRPTELSKGTVQAIIMPSVIIVSSVFVTPLKIKRERFNALNRRLSAMGLIKQVNIYLFIIF